MLRLFGAMLADAAITVGTLGLYPIIRAGENEKSFTGQTLDAMRQERKMKTMIEMLKILGDGKK